MNGAAFDNHNGMEPAEVRRSGGAGLGDEVGTPYCLTVDGQTAEDETVTIRYRDDRRQERIKVAEAVDVVQRALRD